MALVAWSIWSCCLDGRGALRGVPKAGITLRHAPRGGRGADLEGGGCPTSQWKSHNYNHLMEQPTLFYAIALTLALMSFGARINYWLAWGYVGLRILHSIVQATVNVVLYPLHALSRWRRSACSA